MIQTLPTTGLTIGQHVQIEYRNAWGDHVETHPVTAIYEGGTVLAGGKVFRSDGSEKTLARWGARIIGAV